MHSSIDDYVRATVGVVNMQYFRLVCDAIVLVYRYVPVQMDSNALIPVVAHRSTESAFHDDDELATSISSGYAWRWLALNYENVQLSLLNGARIDDGGGSFALQQRIIMKKSAPELERMYSSLGFFLSLRFDPLLLCARVS